MVRSARAPTTVGVSTPDRTAMQIPPGIRICSLCVSYPTPQIRLDLLTTSAQTTARTMIGEGFFHNWSRIYARETGKPGHRRAIGPDHGRAVTSERCLSIEMTHHHLRYTFVVGRTRSE